MKNKTSVNGSSSSAQNLDNNNNKGIWFGKNLVAEGDFTISAIALPDTDDIRFILAGLVVSEMGENFFPREDALAIEFFNPATCDCLDAFQSLKEGKLLIGLGNSPFKCGPSQVPSVTGDDIVSVTEKLIGVRGHPALKRVRAMAFERYPSSLSTIYSAMYRHGDKDDARNWAMKPLQNVLTKDFESFFEGLAEFKRTAVTCDANSFGGVRVRIASIKSKNSYVLRSASLLDKDTCDLAVFEDESSPGRFLVAFIRGGLVSEHQQQQVLAMLRLAEMRKQKVDTLAGADAESLKQLVKPAFSKGPFSHWDCDVEYSQNIFGKHSELSAKEVLDAVKCGLIRRNCFYSDTCIEEEVAHRDGGSSHRNNGNSGNHDNNHGRHEGNNRRPQHRAKGPDNATRRETEKLFVKA
jgi:hypothetical protein